MEFNHYCTFEFETWMKSVCKRNMKLLGIVMTSNAPPTCLKSEFCPWTLDRGSDGKSAREKAIIGDRIRFSAIRIKVSLLETESDRCAKAIRSRLQLETKKNSVPTGNLAMINHFDLSERLSLHHGIHSRRSGH